MPETELGEILETANADPEEGAEWLPYYKASSAILFGVAGTMVGVCQGIINNPAAPLKLKEKMRELGLEVIGEVAAAMTVERFGPSSNLSDERAAEVERFRLDLERSYIDKFNRSETI
jgi:hypothetical protein